MAAFFLRGIVIVWGFVLPLGLAAQTQGSILNLYRQLKSVGLDANQVYDVREASIDREDIHLSLDEGTIAFTTSLNGQITGAFFVGEGELLIVPPDPVERHSLAMFTRSAVLNERFTSAYFRFFDPHLYSDMQTALRPSTEAADFVAKHDSTAKTLAELDALRLLIAMTFDPGPSESSSSPPHGAFIRARLNGLHLGNFDLIWDTSATEEISVGQPSLTDHGVFYDVWMLFPMRSSRHREQSLRRQNESSDHLYVDSVVISDYNIHTEVQPPTNLNVEATLSLSVRKPGERVLLFELSRFLKISAIRLERKDGTTSPLEYIQNEALEGTELARRGNDIVAVAFPASLTRGKRFKLHFAYSGEVLSEAGNGLLYVGARGTWFPNRGPWTSNFDLTFGYPAGWKLLATGKLVSIESKDRFQESRWASENPIPLAGFNLGKYLSATATTGSSKVIVEADAARGVESNSPDQPKISTTIQHRAEGPIMGMDATPPILLDPANNVKTVAERARNTIDFLEPRMGPFPYSSLFVTQMPGLDSQGWPGLIFLSSRVFLTPQQRNLGGPGEQRSAMEIIYDRLMEAHETAHQWWGDAVYWRSYRDQWLMEALANYSALLELETEKSEDQGEVLDFYKKALQTPATGGSLPRKDAGPVTLGLRLDSSKISNGYQIVAYGRGAWLLHMLRHMFRDAEVLSQHGNIAFIRTRKGKFQLSHAASGGGDPDGLFFSVLRTLQSRFAGKVMSTQDFQLALEEALPKSLYYENKPSLDWFFDEWVDGTAIPKIEITDLRFSSAAGRKTARFTLKQNDAPDSLVTSVPIYAAGSDGRLFLVARVFADGSESDFSLKVPQDTKKLILDPFKTVLRSE